MLQGEGKRRLSRAKESVRGRAGQGSGMQLDSGEGGIRVKTQQGGVSQQDLGRAGLGRVSWAQLTVPGWGDEGKQVTGRSSDPGVWRGRAREDRAGGRGGAPRTGLPTSVRILALKLCKLDGGGGGSRWRTLPSEGHDLSSDSLFSRSVAVWSPRQGRALGSGGCRKQNQVNYVGVWDRSETSGRERRLWIFFKGGANRISGWIELGM